MEVNISVDGEEGLEHPDSIVHELEMAPEVVPDAAVSIAEINAAVTLEVANIEAATSLEHHRLEVERINSEWQAERESLIQQVVSLTEQVNLLTAERDNLLTPPPLLLTVETEPEPVTETAETAAEPAAAILDQEAPIKPRPRVRFL